MAENQTQYENKVTLGTKIKVVTALMVVGFAGYVANWVQQPADISTDIFNLPESQSQSQAQTQIQNQNQTATQADFQTTPVDPAAQEAFDAAAAQAAVDAEATAFATAQAATAAAQAAADAAQAAAFNTNFLASAPAPADMHAAAQSLGYPDDQRAGYSFNTKKCVYEPLNPADGPLEGIGSAENSPDQNCKIASSGPEDFLYISAFGAVLFLNRKKLLKRGAR